MQFYLFNIPPKLDHWKGRKLRITLLSTWRHARVIFGMQFVCLFVQLCCLSSSSNVLKKQAKTMTYKNTGSQRWKHSRLSCYSERIDTEWCWWQDAQTDDPGLALLGSVTSTSTQSLNKSPAVTRVSRPYSRCTLATCVHNCPSMMFRTCCCMRPKCKRSYLLIYITSGSYVNKFNVRYLVEILALQIVAKQLQLATWLLLTAYRNLRPIQRYHRRPSTTYRLAAIQNVTDRRTEHRTISATVLPSTVS